MIHSHSEKEGNREGNGFARYFSRGPLPADPELFWEFSTLTFLQRLNSSLLILSSFSLLLGMIAYVYGDALAMVAPILCHLWLQLNVTMFRQALHYLIFMVAYGVSLVAITISSIVWMAFMANKDNASKHTTVRLARDNERLFVVVIWFLLQLIIAVLGGFLIFLAFLAYKLQRAASEGQDLSTSERHVESGLQKARPEELRAAPVESRQSPAEYREERGQDPREHAQVHVRHSPKVHRDERTNDHYDNVYDDVHDTRMGRHTAHNEHAHDDVNRHRNDDFPSERASDARHSQHTEKGLHKTTISVGTVAVKAVKDEARHSRSTEKPDNVRPSRDHHLEQEAGADSRQTSTTGVPARDTPKSARFTKNTVVDETLAEERKENERDETLHARENSSERHSPHQDHDDRRHSTSSSAHEQEGDQHSGHGDRARHSSSSSSSEEEHKHRDSEKTTQGPPTHDSD